MTNPILETINNRSSQQPNNSLNGIRNMMNLVNNSNDPRAMLNYMMANDPRMKEVQSIIDANGGDAKTAFYNLAKQKGVDPNSILNMLNG